MSEYTANRLNQLLNDAQPEARLGAVNQIRVMGPEGSEFIEKLWDVAIDDPSREVREQACMAISARPGDREGSPSR